jgi:hypothetical protein
MNSYRVRHACPRSAVCPPHQIGEYKLTHLARRGLLLEGRKLGQVKPDLLPPLTGVYDSHGPTMAWFHTVEQSDHDCAKVYRHGLSTLKGFPHELRHSPIILKTSQ